MNDAVNIPTFFDLASFNREVRGMLDHLSSQEREATLRALEAGAVEALQQTLAMSPQERDAKIRALLAGLPSVHQTDGTQKDDDGR